MIYSISRAILKLFFKICFRYRAKNADRFPKKGPFLIASNHLSFLDPAAVGIATRIKIHFIAREDLFDNALFNLWGRSVGAIPIKRGRFDLSAIKGVLDCLHKGEVVALFPEGTRSRDGKTQRPKAGVGFAAVKAGVAVVPVCVKGTDKALPAHAICVRLRPVELRVAEPVYPNMFLKSNNEYDYEALSQEVMDRIEKLSRDEN